MYYLPKSRRMKWSGQVTLVGEMINNLAVKRQRTDLDMHVYGRIILKLILKTYKV
jgi:hypothetical protein